MTRIDAKNSSISIKTPKKHNNFHCGLLFLNIVLIIFLIIAYFITKETKKPSSEDLSENFVVRSIPRLYTKLENIDPEERDVFQGFQTSFLPPEEIVLASKGHPEKRARKGEEEYEGNVTSDYSEEDDLLLRTRVKRMSLTSHNQDDEDNEQKEPIDDEYSEDIESDEDSDYDSTEYEENENLKRIMNPETQADKGPLDDVVEQIRGQPELEEAETGSAPNLYNPRKLVTGIHAFWKGQGNKETIRNTQAQIMLKYMDLDANPCEDFYQYACGNWASMNPIPADKAGYDTFEMLRENLDIVLKDLLEFKSHERVPSVHPSKNLINHIIFLKKIPKDMCAVNNIKGNSNLSTQISLDELIKNTSMPETDIETAAVYADEKIKNSTSWESKHSKSEIINRIRRYLDRKSELINHPISTLALKLRKYFGHKNSHKAASNNLIAKPFDDKEQRRVKNSLIRRNQFGRKLLAYKTNKVKKRKTRQITPVSSDDYDSLENAIEYSLNTGDAQLKARYLFKSCMNTSILDMRGHQPLLDLIDQLGGWPILNPNWNSTHFDYLEVMAQLRLYNNDILLSEWVGPDIKNSDEFVVQFDQTSLGLPSRDYFLQKSNRIYLAAYRSYLVTVALLLGGNPEHVKKSARKLIEFEVKLAKITSAPEDRRNVSELYQRMPLSKLEALVPEIDWRRYLCIVMNRTVGSEETVVLFALTYVRNLVKLIEQTDPAVLSDYLLWRFVRHRVNNLDDRFQSAKQQFYFILFGREEAPPRWKNCISQVNANMGMALGSMFVKNYFDEISKNDTLTMTREIQQSFRELLRITDWIDVKTKELAAHKVDAMMLRIGYPDFILNKEELDDRYKEVTVHPDMYFENILNILQHLTKMEQSRIGQPVNKTLWNTAPAVVNAYYSRNKNQIMFPAGILQPPFYHRHFPRSLNYGGIGVVIGHEITHGFDDKGRLFDCHGNLQRWWSDSAIEVFHNRAQCLIDQYGKYVVPEVNIPLNGVNTQGENIADNGGVKQAFRAYMNWLEGHSADDETLPGLNHTHKQLFFLNFAQVWCGAMRPEAMRNKLKTAVHSPGRFRVIGTLSNSEDFAREFHCAKGTPMNPVWCGAMRPEAMRNKPKTAVHSPGRFRVIGTLSNSEDFAREFHCAKGTPMNPVEKCNVW